MSRLISSMSSFSSSHRVRAPLPCTCSSPPGLAFSSPMAAATSSDRTVVFAQRGSVSVFDATYLGCVFRAPTQLAAVAPAREQELVGLAAVARPPGGDRQSLAVAVLVLAPRFASTAGLVGRAQALGHHPLQVAIARDRDQVLVDRERARRPPRRPLERQRLQQPPPLPVRQRPGRAAGEVQHVKDDQRRRRRRPRRMLDSGAVCP
jgi:hypothetical protein